MKKITFDFLKNMELKEIEKTPVSSPNSKVPAPGAHLRLFADGSVYPSAELVALHHLEYQPTDSDQPEMGYDVFVSTDWGQYTGAIPFVALALVSKHEPKVSLFSQTKYNDDKTPKSSVLTQKTTAGEELIKALSAVYLEKPEDNLFENKAYLDLALLLDQPLAKTTSGVYHLPKTVVKGKDAGKATYVRRENIQIFPLTIVEESVNQPATPVVKAEPVNNTEKAAAAMFGA